MLRPLVALALILGSSQAQAAPPWNGFQAAFPLLPCQDGWASCLVNGAEVTPDLGHDGTGAVAPSDLRIGWFDLAATPAFSPFGSLSVYPAGGDDAAAAAEPDPAPAPAPTQASRDAEEASRASREAAEAKAAADAQSRQAQEAKAQADAEAKRAAQERADADAKAKSEAEAARKARDAAANASAADKARLEMEARAAEAARVAAEAQAKKRAEEQARLEADRKAKEEAAKAAAADAAKKAAEEEARRKAEDEAKKKAADDAAAKQAAANGGGEDGSAMVDPGAAAASGDCSNTTDLEPMAMLGKLSEGQVACLNGRLQTDAKMTDKDKVSRVIMANAWAKGDKKGWEKQAKYHLEEIDQSDPDLCYKYALRLAGSGVGRASGAIHWADVALENRTVWTGDEYVSKVYGLYKMRAVAAQEMWKAAEAAHVAAPTDDTKKKMEDARNLTKVYAREWYEYAKASGKDKVPAQQLCMSAAGTADYCEGS
jgi:hypothetical protein